MKNMQGHRKSVGTGAVIHFHANDELVGRVIAIKRKRERDALRYEIGGPFPTRDIAERWHETPDSINDDDIAAIRKTQGYE